MSDNEQKRHVISIHEAGHAVVGILLGGQVEGIQMAGKHECRCRFRLEDPSARNRATDRERADYFRRVSLKAIGGWGAEYVFFGQDSEGAAEDFQTSGAAVREMWRYGGRKNSDIECHKRVVYRLFKSPHVQATIECLASEIRNRDFITGPEVHAIVKPYFADPNEHA